MNKWPGSSEGDGEPHYRAILLTSLQSGESQPQPPLGRPGGQSGSPCRVLYESLGDPRYRRVFQREPRAAAALQHREAAVQGGLRVGRGHAGTPALC